jgi:hypothetical protein
VTTIAVRARGAAGRWIGVLVAASVVLGSSMAPAGAPRIAVASAKIDVRADPITAFERGDPTRTRFGKLEFRGGLELTSSYRAFGGLSALRVSAGGERFLAISDKGRWFRGRILYGDRRPTGLADVETAPALGPDGRPLSARGWYDTESIAEDGGTLYVGIERVNQIVRFDYGKDGLQARGVPIAVPPEVKQLPYNKGLEALVFVRPGLPLAGTLLALSERGLDAAGNLVGFLIGGPSPGIFSVKRIDEFDISDAALLPEGDLLVLERRFTWLTGIAMRIRRIALASIRPGVLVDGSILIEANMGHQIDNMEGIAVHLGTAGETVLTLISDDNFSPLQRTVLLQFTLAEP